ncbi:DNA helicase RecQ [Rhizorhapis sp.]|uniref:DNA helicase RecQ n=1 Tax=Rhizorhapis sp. TaxID=1968842 RepID=UPI002B4A4E06|nr:DNA helicase RecQ [Rhizorhapis sp.]HKR18331.1 DNA helicase RecQ [Rhizorhapis sp.]
MPVDPLHILHQVFGFSAFRGVQADVVERVLSGQHTLAIMPTGAGKSLCYQLPAVALEGCCVVISPLIALMHDQLRAAQAVGIRAASLTSVDTDWRETQERLRSGRLDILYVAPERASGQGFRDLLRASQIAMFAIDEAHCVSEWGHDFRPDYRMLRPLLDDFPAIPRLALTATADAHTRQDILVQLGIPAAGMIISGFDRPNIRYAAHPRAGLSRQIADLVASRPGPGIIYAQTRMGTEKIAEGLSSMGREVRIYHAGLSPEERRSNQAAFIASEDMVMVATIAFGMGIDKPDVRFVAHAGLPKSIEAYYQESGRAGRDGEPAEAHLFWGADDFAKARQRIFELDEGRQTGERARIASLGALVETAGCRRAILLRHFGEAPPQHCGNCDNCLNPPQGVDATELARKFLSAVYRTGQSFGAGHIEAVLTGSANDKVAQRGHDRLSVFGIVEAGEAALIKPVSRALLLRDALQANEHGGLELGPNARPILRGEQPVTLILPPKKDRRGRRDKQPNPVGDPLFDALRACRRELALEAGVPPYVIFHDSTLREMAERKPTSIFELSQISGVGTRKLEAYGQPFLETIAGYSR